MEPESRINGQLRNAIGWKDEV